MITPLSLKSKTGIIQLNPIVTVYIFLQLFNGTFSRAMEAGGVELLMQKLDKFFYRVKSYAC